MHTFIKATTEEEAKVYIGGHVMLDPLHPDNEEDFLESVGEVYGTIIDSFIAPHLTPTHGLTIQFADFAAPFMLPGERVLLRMDS